MKNQPLFLKLFLLTLVACNQSSDFYELPDAAQLEYGMVQTSANGPDWKTQTNYDMGRRPFASTSKSTVYVKNIGDLPASVDKVWLESKHAEYFSVEHRCDEALVKDKYCPIHIVYEPRTVGSTPAVLHVSYANGSGGFSEKTLPLNAVASNLAFLKFEQEKMDVKTNTIGYTLSMYYKVLYNGSSLAAKGLSIEPAKGVIISDPTDDSFKIDRNATTCGEIINSDCIVKVDFSPTVVGPDSATFNLNYFNGAEVLKITGESLGTGLEAAVLADLTAGPGDFGNVVANPPSPVGMSIPVYFNGSVPADNVVIRSPNNAVFDLVSDKNKTTCGSKISGHCNLYVTFEPKNYTEQTDSITIEYTSNGQTRSPLKISLRGKGVQPAMIQSDAQTLAYGSIPAFKTISKKFTLTNTGDVALTKLSGLTITDLTNFSGSFDAKCATLAPKDTCGLNINYRPKSDAAGYAEIAFSYFDGRETKTMKLSASGTGTSPLVLEGSRTIDFGNVMIGHPTLPGSISVGLGIYGMTALTPASQFIVNPTALSSPFAYLASSTPGLTSGCRAPLDPKKSNGCSFGVSLITNVGFAPDVLVSQAFSIAYTGDNNNGKGTLSFTAKMTPRLPPVVAFTSVPAIKTVSVNDSTTITVTLKNNSPYFATGYRSAAVEGDSSFTIQSNGCSGGIAANTSCSMVVKFNPKDAGNFTGKLKYVYSDQIKDQTIYANLSATGSSEVTLLAGASTIDFGSVYVGDTIAAKVVDIRYFGKSDWTQTLAVAAPFKVTPVACGSQKDCKISIEFNPTAAGSFNSVAEMTYSPALNKPGVIKLTLKGSAALRAPTLSVSPTNLGKTLVGQQSTKVLTIKNTGTTSAEQLEFNDLKGVMNFALDGAPGSTGNCALGQTLKSGESCTVKVTFTPTKVGAEEVALGIGYAVGTARSSTSIKLNATGTQMIQVFAGGFQTCIINELGQIVCWGRNSSGQLGQGNMTALSKKPQELAVVKFSAGQSIQSLAVGDAHTCALIDDVALKGQVSCWGSNANGRLGLGVNTAHVPQPLNGNKLNTVNLGEEATAIAAGFEHTCALTKTGKVKCWGGNTSGQLGTGNAQSVGSVPAQMGAALKSIDLGARAIGISAGAGHSCAVLENGSTKCWGDNFYGQLGQGSDADKIGPSANDMSQLAAIKLGSSFNVKSIQASSGAFTCAVSTNGEMKCFGKTVANESSSKPFFGVLGHCWSRQAQNTKAIACGSDTQSVPTNSIGYLANDMGNSLPMVALNSPVEQFAVGSSFTCYLSDKSVKCWGLNDQGQLGIGNRLNIGANQSEMHEALKPALTLADGEPIQVAAGYEHACSVLRNNTVRCWGSSAQNATGLAFLGVQGSTGVSPSTTPSLLPTVYDGR